MGAFSNPISIGSGGTGRGSSTPLQRREDRQRADFYAQSFELWQDYVSRLRESMPHVSVSETRRLASRSNLKVLPRVLEGSEVLPLAESGEMTWLTENSRYLERYRGEWLLIEGQHLVAHGANFGDIRAAIRERNIQSPFVYYVPTVQEGNFVSI
jgi:hypothetical protein